MKFAYYYLPPEKIDHIIVWRKNLVLENRSLQSYFQENLVDIFLEIRCQGRKIGYNAKNWEGHKYSWWWFLWKMTLPFTNVECLDIVHAEAEDVLTLFSLKDQIGKPLGSQ